jgi:peptidyl-prolyl cis-trans isomerase D
VLLEEYQAEEDERRFIEQADRLIDIIYEDPTTLDAAADELGLAVMETEPFGRLGDPNGVISSNPEVVRAAYSDLVLGQGSVSDPIDLGTNHIVLLRLKEHLPRVLRPLDEVRDEVAMAIRQDRALKAARSQAESMLATLESGSGLAEIAEANGMELITIESGKRYGGGTDPNLVQKVFNLPRPAEGESLNRVVELQNSFALVQLTAVADGEIAEGAELLATTYERMASNATASEEALGFMRMLRAQSEIEIFEDRL